ncbi:MAG: uvrC [Francisellaceae bacterium]|nr:uvrC [Francisellaceae bacterium]
MLDKLGTVIYIGKAKNLKKRVTSYFQKKLDSKTLQLVGLIDSIEVTVTPSEREALLLENNLIKQLKPKYNVIFKDDKSYPYLQLSTHHPFPGMNFYRGNKQEKGEYFGPFPSSRGVRESLDLLQKIFKIRQCDDTFFKNRTRPCLQYQIKRCSGPCCHLIAESDYRNDVNNAILFLQGNDNKIIESLIQKMNQASIHLDYETALKFRDQMVLLRELQKQQIITNLKGEIDVLGINIQNSDICVHILYIRQGKILGSRQYFPKVSSFLELNPSHILETFILQHYLQDQFPLSFPKEILVSSILESKESLNQILSEQLKLSIQISDNVRGDRQKWVEMAAQSAEKALKAKVIKSSKLSHRFELLAAALKLDNIPQRIECFDVSHSFGEATVASNVVFDPNGPLKSDYRRFNIQKTANGDDYQALEEALTRHFIKVKSEGLPIPDILLIDGGKGQLKRAEKVLTELQVTNVILIGVAKGAGRKAGLETLFLHSSGKILPLAEDSPALLLILQIRDEAHRFAITAHKNQRTKIRLHSKLQDIPGIGDNRRKRLIQQFGGLQEVKEASLEELTKIPGISKTLAKRIYDTLHGS